MSKITQAFADNYEHSEVTAGIMQSLMEPDKLMLVTFENLDGIEIQAKIHPSFGIQVGDSVRVAVNHSEIVKRIIKVEVTE